MSRLIFKQKKAILNEFVDLLYNDKPTKQIIEYSVSEMLNQAFYFGITSHGKIDTSKDASNINSKLYEQLELYKSMVKGKENVNRDLKVKHEKNIASKEKSNKRLRSKNRNLSTKLSRAVKINKQVHELQHQNRLLLNKTSRLTNKSKQVNTLQKQNKRLYNRIEKLKA